MRRDRNTRVLTSLRRPVTLRNIRKRQGCLRGKWAHAKLGRMRREVCKRGLRWMHVKQQTLEALMASGASSHPALHPAPRVRRRGRARINRRRPGGGRERVQERAPPSRRVSGGSRSAPGRGRRLRMRRDHARVWPRDPVPVVGSGNPGERGERGNQARAWRLLGRRDVSRSPGTNNRDNVCIFDWTAWARDAYPGVQPQVRPACGPRQDAVCGPGELSVRASDIWCVGQVWSSALWDLRQEIGGISFDRILLSSSFSTRPTSTSMRRWRR